MLSPATSARGPRNAEKRQHIGDGPEGGFSPGGAEEAVVLLMERSLKTFDPEDDAEGPDAIIREAHAGHGPPAVPMPVPAVPAGSGADVSGASGELRRHRAVPGKGSCGSLGQNRTSSTLPDADACAEAVAGDADATSMPVTSPPDLTARQDSTPAEVDSLINALSPRAGIAHAASRGKGASSPGDVAPQAGGWGAVGGREKRDPRPSSSGEPSRLSNDPPKRQRKGADLVIQVAARQSRGQDDEEVTPVQSQISPVEEVALIQGQRLPLGKMMQSSVEEEPQVQHSVQENAGGRDGGGAAEAVQKGQGVVSHGAVGVEEPLHAAERAGDNSRRRVPTDNERGTGHSHSFEGHSGAGGPPVGAASSRGGALEAQEGGSAEGAGAAAWGSSLVCADLTIHEVGSHYRPGSIPGALHIKVRTPNTSSFTPLS